MARTVDEVQFETSHLKDLPPDSWKVRPCELYKEEYSDCTSFKARFHQYYIFGEHIDCTDWKQDYDNCMLWRKFKDLNALKHIIASEDERKRKRLAASAANDVWELRTEPPKEWNAPLPEILTKDFEHSYLSIKKKEDLERKSLATTPDVKKNSFCAIS